MPVGMQKLRMYMCSLLGDNAILVAASQPRGGVATQAIAPPGVDLFDGHFFGAMEWLMFFSRAPSALMVFQWFCQR